MSDTAIIYYTANEAPASFAAAVRAQIDKAADGLPIISVSQKPLDFGENICVGEIGQHVYNIFQQVLVGAKAATTRYVAMAEDDILYSREHFHTHIPSPGVFAYDMARWGVFTWTDPQIFSVRVGRKCMSMLTCERELLIESLEERFAAYPDKENIPLKWFGEPGRYERGLKLTIRPTEEFWANVPSIMFTHPAAVAYRVIHGTRKSHGTIRATEIPVWGRAEDIAKFYR